MTPRVHTKLVKRRRRIKANREKIAALPTRKRSKAARENRVVISLELTKADKPVVKAMLKQAGQGATVAQLIRTGLKWYARTLGVSSAKAFTAPGV